MTIIITNDDSFNENVIVSWENYNESQSNALRPAYELHRHLQSCHISRGPEAVTQTIPNPEGAKAKLKPCQSTKPCQTQSKPKNTKNMLATQGSAWYELFSPSRASSRLRAESPSCFKLINIGYMKQKHWNRIEITTPKHTKTKTVYHPYIMLCHLYLYTSCMSGH